MVSLVIPKVAKELLSNRKKVIPVLGSLYPNDIFIQTLYERLKFILSLYKFSQEIKVRIKYENTTNEIKPLNIFIY
jgi:hypothetical protein